MSGENSDRMAELASPFFPRSDDETTLVDVLDRLLDRGVVVSGELTVSVADVDLLFVGVRLFLSSVDTIEDARATKEETEDRRSGEDCLPPALRREVA